MATWQRDVTWQSVRDDIDAGRAYRATVTIEDGKPVSYTADYGNPAEELDAAIRASGEWRARAEDAWAKLGAVLAWARGWELFDPGDEWERGWNDAREQVITLACDDVDNAE
jgi:hypothetical protein